MNESLLSSPDPLQDSLTYATSNINYATPTKPRQATKVTSSFASNGSSPRKQKFELDVGSHQKPQKIIVTVEADLSDKENFYPAGKRSPVKRSRAPVQRRNGTTTTIIPVKGLTDSDDEAVETQLETPKRGRGRPRKSGTPIPNKSKSLGKRRTLGSLVDGDDSEDWSFTIGTAVEVGRGKGRSRSRSTKGRKATPALNDTRSDEGVPSTTRRRKTLATEVLEDEIQEVGSDDSQQALLEDATTRRQEESPASNDVLSLRLSSPEQPRAAAGSEQEESHAEFSAMQCTSNGSYASPRTEEANYQDEAEDDVGPMHEFEDTMLESEGFSMISIDSVPSLREHLSSPASTRKSSQRDNSSPPSVHSDAHQSEQSEVRTGSPENIARDVPASANPVSRPINPRLSAVQSITASALDDSFSTIASDILEAASPVKNQVATRRRTPVPRLLGVPNAHDADNSFSSIAPAILEAATPKPMPKPFQFLQNRSRKTFDDSFSSIPPSILDAASPAKNYFRKSPNVQSLTIDSVASRRVSGGSDRLRESSRLLTPEETPSPALGVEMQHHSHENQNKSSVQSQSKFSNHNDSIEGSFLSNNSQMRSSPPSMARPRLSAIDLIRHGSNLHYSTSTPSIFFSSPKLPPPPQQQANPRQLQTNSIQVPTTTRQSLSPVLRAGRALQGIVIPTSSPRARAQSLRSPFKSPVAHRRSDSAGLGSGDSSILDRVGQESNDVIYPRLHEQFSGTLLARGRESMQGSDGNGRTSSRRSSLVHDDPFRSVGPVQRTSPEQQPAYTLGRPGSSQSPSQKGKQSADDILRDVDEMSWQADSSLVSSVNKEKESSTSKMATVATDTADQSMYQREAEWAQERAAVSQQINSASPDQVIVIDSDSSIADSQMDSTLDSPAASVPLPEDDDDDDIWLTEAKHSSSLIEEDASSEPKQTVADESAVGMSFGSVDTTNGQKSAKLSDASGTESSSFPSQVVLKSNSPVPIPSINQSDTSMASVESEPHPVPAAEKFKENVKPSTLISKDSLFKSGFNSFAPSQQRSSLGSISKFNQPLRLPKQRLSSRSSMPANPSIPQDEGSSSLLEPSLLGHIPQKSNFTPRPRQRDTGNLDLSALLGASPVKNPFAKPVKTMSFQNEQTASHAAQQNGDVKITQKSNFAPQVRQFRQRDTRNLDLSALLGSSPVKNPFLPSAELERSSTDLSIASGKATTEENLVTQRNEPICAPIFTATQEEVINSAVSPTEDTQTTPTMPKQFQFQAQKPIVFPMQTRTPSLSPQKSCFRRSLPGMASPSKSVVFEGHKELVFEKNSSILSIEPEVPDLDTSGTSCDSAEDIDADAKRNTMYNARRDLSPEFEHLTEEESISAAVDAYFESHPLERVEPVMPAKPEKPAKLSQTTWTKAHWKLLEKIYHDTLSAPESSLTPPSECRSPFLGLTIEGQGETMVLESWHLDVVDWWRDEVCFGEAGEDTEGGSNWDEEFVIMRLFGLIKSEEQKSKARELEKQKAAGKEKAKGGFFSWVM